MGILGTLRKPLEHLRQILDTLILPCDDLIRPKDFCQSLGLTRVAQDLF